MADLIKELQAKAWQSSRRGKRHSDHVTWRAADEIEALLAENKKLWAILKKVMGLLPEPRPPKDARMCPPPEIEAALIISAALGSPKCDGEGNE